MCTEQTGHLQIRYLDYIERGGERRERERDSVGVCVYERGGRKRKKERDPASKSR